MECGPTLTCASAPPAREVPAASRKARLASQGEDVAIVRAIVDLGGHLGLDVVAEGVEDQQAWDLLQGMGCDLVQGWHLSRAMPVDELVPWLRSYSRAGHRPGLHAI